MVEIENKLKKLKKKLPTQKVNITFKNTFNI